MKDKAMIFAEIAIGVILGFMVYSYVAPSLAGATSVTPSA